MVSIGRRKYCVPAECVTTSNLAAGATVEGSLCHLGFEASKLVDEDPPQSC